FSNVSNLTVEFQTLAIVEMHRAYRRKSFASKCL
ncbi:unnamed protein product, partial [marine sediment metagenome]